MKTGSLISFLFVGLILLSSIGFATDQLAQRNSTTTFYDVTNTITGVLTGNITILNSTFDVINSGNMYQSLAFPGKFAYNYTPNQTGNYFVTATITNGTSTETQTSTLTVVNYLNNIAQDTSDIMQTIFTVFILFLVPFLLSVLAQYTKIELFFVFSGVWFIASAGDLVFQGASWYSWAFYALLGLFLTYHGLSLLFERNERNKNLKDNNGLFESETEF